MNVDVASLRSRVLEQGWTRERALAIVGAALVVAPFVLPKFQVFLFTELLAVVLFATAFNLLYGYTGLLSFGHALFYAAAGYGLAIFLNLVGDTIATSLGGVGDPVAFVAALVVGVLFAIVIAIPIGYLSVRLEEIYFALITLSFGMAFYALVLQDVGGLTNGSDGLIVLLGSIDAGPMSTAMTDPTLYYFLVLGAVVPSMYLLWRIVHSPFGLVCRAMRESPDRARALGVNVRFHQWIAFVLSAAFVGVAGAFVVPLYNVVSPDLAHWTTSAIPVIAAVIGGASFFLGPAVGAFIFLYLRWAISRHPALEAHWELVFGIVVIVMLLYFKEGVAGWLNRIVDRRTDERTETDS